LASVRGLTNLSILDLGETSITDAGLVRLRGVTELRALYLKQTKVTDAAVEGLEDALPDLIVGR